MGNFLALIGLSLLDSLSVGTLVIPLVLILRKGRIELPALLTYLTTVAIVYFLLGASFLLGFTYIADVFSAIFHTNIFSWICLILGVALALFGIFSPSPQERTAEEIDLSIGKGIEVGRRNLPSMVLLGLGASLAEAATMLPYLAGIGIITNFNTEYAWKFAILAGYCLVMILPVLVIIFGLKKSEESTLARIRKWIPKLQYEGKITLLWIAAIVGIRMAILSSQNLHFWGG